ncbi:glycosyltransferase [Caldimonas tepidiphila]|uniref:glycosyltransferase n=1 Tax=Caldimonas tepidiphila TaxID=2315841 RepID=UPI000E5A94DA|nr:glycosyltransferase [Caldimonas tepidiphila]
MPDLIVFSHLRWDFVFQRPQHLLSRLAQHFRVIVVEEPERGEGLPHFRRSTPQQNIEVLRPVTPVEAGGFHDDQLSVLQPLLVEHLRREGIEDYLVWFYTPMALPLLSQLSPRAIVYDCMDELASFKNAPRQMRQRETALLKMADLVFTGGPSLYEAKRDLHPSVHCLPSAVDVGHYAPANIVHDPETEALQAHIPGPRLGFFGVIDERLDPELIGRLADAHPEWQVVMVGPVVKIDPARLPQRPNIHWLGQQDYKRLPQLVAGWDLCLMPFAINEATRFISPTKTLEYMAAEKPVVSTPVRDVVGLYGDVVRIAHDPAEFIAACEEALAETGHRRTERLGAMLASVSRFSWDGTATVMRELIEEVLAKRPAAMPHPGMQALTADVLPPNVVLAPTAQRAAAPQEAATDAAAVQAAAPLPAVAEAGRRR